MSEPVWAIGLMTGTVLDGNIDIAALRTDGDTVAAFGPWRLARYPDAVLERLREALTLAAEWQFAPTEPPAFAAIEAALTAAQADAVAEFLQAENIARRDVRVIGFHGQTVLHRAPGQAADGTRRRGATRQLGDGAAMAARLGIDVVHDFRRGDMAAGGQGAPLAPAYHAALLRRIGAGPDTAVLNLGGVANLSWSDGDGTLYGFDTGPANAPVNDWVHRHTGAAMDRDGALATSGQVDETRLAALLRHPYLQAPPPKSLDRNDFTLAMADGLDLADGAATLTAFSAGAVALGLDRLPSRPSRLIVCGGGRHNPALMRELLRRTGCRIEPAEQVGWRGDAIEAECFAFLAVRRLHERAISFPQTTGVPQPMTGGVLARAPLPAAGEANSPRA